jgi:pSer/pThr/pTyr-binding forkhead associated (FHA) protein
MSNQLSDLEKRLQNLIEVHLVRYLPGTALQDRIAQRMAEALRIQRAQISTQELDESRQIIPNQFQLVVNPATVAQWQKDPRLLEGLTKVFGLVANEIGLQFSNPPTLTLLPDPQMSINSIDVRISKGESIAETQILRESGEEAPIRSAFLIVGGTKVFTLEKAVTNIGRRLDNHLVVDDPRVSRYHAQIRYVRGRFIIFDLNSTGGTYVNGQRNTQSVLYPGDVISLSGLPIVFGQDNPPHSINSGDTAPLSPAVSDRKTAALDSTPEQNDPQK